MFPFLLHCMNGLLNLAMRRARRLSSKLKVVYLYSNLVVNHVVKFLRDIRGYDCMSLATSVKILSKNTYNMSNVLLSEENRILLLPLGQNGFM